MKRIFVTGGTGFVGSVLMCRLLENDYDVVSLVKTDTELPKTPNSARCSFITGDILDRERLTDQIAGADIVIHCAAVVPDRADEATTWEVNVEGTRNVVAACVHNEVKRLVHISTDSIYGDGPTVDAREDTSIDTRYHKEGNYPLSKLEAERIIGREWSVANRDTVIFRPCMLYGPGSSSATDVFREWASKGLKLLVGGGRARLSILYVSDLVEAILLAVGREGPVNAVYNISDGCHYTKKEIMTSLRRLQGGPRYLVPLPGKPVEWLFRVIQPVLGVFARGSPLYRAFDPERIRFAVHDHTINIDRALDELGYRPRVLLDEGLRRTFEDREAGA